MLRSAVTGEDSIEAEMAAREVHLFLLNQNALVEAQKKK
jgi:hypothetical protein